MQRHRTNQENFQKQKFLKTKERERERERGGAEIEHRKLLMNLSRTPGDDLKLNLILSKNENSQK